MINYHAAEEINLDSLICFEVSRGHLGSLLNMDEPLVEHIRSYNTSLYLVFRTQYDNDLFRIKYPEISNVESYKD